MPLHYLCLTVPVSEDLARTLDFKIFLDVLGGLVIEQPMGILLPGEDLKLKTEWIGRYVAAFETGFIFEIIIGS